MGSNYCPNCGKDLCGGEQMKAEEKTEKKSGGNKTAIIAAFLKTKAEKRKAK